MDKDSSGKVHFKELTHFFSHSLLPDIRDESPSAISLSFITKIHSEKKILNQTETKTMSFLVVDDSQVTLKTTQKTLKKAGHKVSYSESINESVCQSTLCSVEFDSLQYFRSVGC